MRPGIQMYSLREHIEKCGLESALSIIADAGFEGAELAGFYGRTADELKTLFDKYGLEPFSAHIGIEDIEKSLPALAALGIKHVVVPWAQIDKPDVLEALAAKMSALKTAPIFDGFTLGYHNHAHEFENGRDRVSELADRVDIELEPDVFWMAVAGADACEFIRRHASKIRLVHIKELGDGGDSVNPVVGKGRANVAAVLDLCRGIGTEWAVLEIEKIDMPLKEYLKACCEFMRKHC